MMKQRLELRTAAVLCYLFWFLGGIVVLSAERRNRFVRFHAVQSVLLSALLSSGAVALAVADLALLCYGWLTVGGALWLFVMYKAGIGRWYQLPFIEVFAERHA